MGIIRAGNDILLWGQALLVAGTLLAGCKEGDEPQPPAAPVKSVARTQTLPESTPPPPPAVAPTKPLALDDGLDAFKQDLARRFDRKQMHTRPASAEGGIHHIPNGRADHATVLVKNPDGTVSKECVSSSLEVSALVEELRKGRAQ